eukprot:4116162-Pyramimonas_sp.AAC.3
MGERPEAAQEVPPSQLLQGNIRPFTYLVLRMAVILVNLVQEAVTLEKLLDLTGPSELQA